MLVYCCMYAVPALGTLVLGTSDPDGRRPRLGLFLLLAAFAVLIGLREQVGTDWFNYIRTLDRLSYTSFSGTFAYKDPGFGFIAWASTRLGWGIYGPDAVCGAILMIGVAALARRQPDAWLAVTAAVPYLVIVVGMGYVRQAAAIGFILIAITRFEDRRYAAFTGWMIAASLFHGPSLCILPLAALVLGSERPAVAIPLGIIVVLLFAVLLRGRVVTFYSTYVEANYDSSGAAIRLVMDAIPAAIFLVFRKRFAEDRRTRSLWTLFALIALLLLALLPIFPSSTALDRFGLYFVPIQLFVFGRLPRVLGETPQAARMLSYAVVLYYGAVLFIWLRFASNAHAWLPYRFAPLS